MKLLLIYFLIIFNLYAEIPSQLEKKISNTSVQINWSDIDKDIQSLVIKKRDIIINKLIPTLDKPILEPLKDNNLPKILLTRNDYKLLFFYIKYLQSQDKTNEAINLYIRTLKGRNQVDKTNSVSLIYSIVRGKETLESLRFDIENNFSQEDKLLLKKSLPNLLTLKENDLKELLNHEIIIQKEILNIELLKIFKQDKTTKIVKIVENSILDYNIQLYLLKDKESMDKLEKNFSIPQNILFKKYSKEVALLKREQYNLTFKFTEQEINLLKKLDTDTISRLIFHTSRSKFGATKLDLLKVIDLNQEVLKLLKIKGQR